jgi:uroporphyrinogen-III synthase
VSGLVLVTRPAPDAALSVAAVERLGFRALAAPVQRVRLRRGATLPAAAALLLTSRNAVRAVAGQRRLRGLPAFCVGDATAALAREAGFVRVVSADGDADALADLVAARLDAAGGPLLLPTTEHAGARLCAALRARGFRIHRRVVYRMLRQPGLPAAAHAALAEGRVSHVLFHAAGAAAAFCSLLRTAGLAETVRKVEACALSAAAAKPLGTLPWRKTSWPARPNEAAMLAMLASRPRRRRA